MTLLIGAAIAAVILLSLGCGFVVGMIYERQQWNAALKRRGYLP